MSSTPERNAHKRAIRAAFDRAAPSYDSAAGIQREICDALAELVPPAPEVARILDAGCGTGYALPGLQARFPRAHVVGFDFAPAMLARLDGGAASRVCGDLEELPFADAAFDRIWSSLALQWCDPNLALGEFARILRVGGRAYIATLAPGTLAELRDAFAAIDDTPRVLAFHEPDFWTHTAERHGFTIAHSRRFVTAVRDPELRGILRHIKSIGAHRTTATPRPPLNRSQWRTLEARYALWRDAAGLLPASYDVLLLALEKRPATA